MGYRATKYVVKRLIKRRCKGDIARSGEESLRVNCFAIYLNDGDESSLLVTAVTDRAYVGRYWDGSSFSADASIPFSYAKEVGIQIKHYYRQYDFTYKSIAHYLLNGVTGFDRLRAFINKAGQFWFNRKELVLSERIDVLKVIVIETISNRSFEVTEVTLPRYIHGYRWILHPDRARQQLYAKLLLESLELSGDVKKGKLGYLLTGKALETISRYENSERKHQQSLGQSKSMKWLTLALISVGLVQAYVAYISAQ